MKLSEVSIQRPVLASMMSLALVLFGVISLKQLPVREIPSIDPPIVTVTTVYPGANASVVESEVTERIEESVNNISGIKTLTSESREQVSNVTIEFTLARDIELCAQDVRDRVSRIRGLLPDTVDEPTIAKQEADAQPIMWIGMSSATSSTEELTNLVERQVKNIIQTVDGVSSIIIGGEKRFAIRLWLDSEEMAAHRVTVLDVERALQAQNVELPSGRVENWDREMTIKTLGELKTTEEFNRLVILRDGDRFVRLSDIGEARQGVEDERSAARVNGRPCVFMGIVKQSKANTVAVAKGVKERLDLLNATLPPDTEITVNYDESIYVEKAINEVWITLGIAFALVTLVIYVFLHSARATVIPAVAAPVSILSTFAVLAAFGYSVNILTMLALVLAIGIVVDDSIVVLENIHRHIELGKTPIQAAFHGMREIAFAVIATTVALVAVFTPLAFQTSTTGRLFIEFAVAVTAAVIISSFVALTLSPTIAARTLRAKHNKPSVFVRVFESILNGVSSNYKRSLNVFLNLNAWARTGLALAVFASVIGAAAWLFQHLEGDFLPPEDKGRMFAFVIAPDGSTAEYTDRMLQQAEAILGSVPEVQTYGSVLAPAFSGPGEASSGIVFVRLKAKRDRSVQEIVNGPGGIRDRFFGQIEGAIAIANIPKSINRSFNAPFQLVLQGSSLEQLDQFATAYTDKLKQAGFLINVQSSFVINKPELEIEIQRDRAAALGVSVDDISRTLQILFGGSDISQIKRDGKEYDVIAQLNRESRLRPNDLDRVYVKNSESELIQLSGLIDRTVGVAPNQIDRYNRLRSAAISGTPMNVTMGEAMERAEALLKEDLPAGMLYSWEGESADLDETGQEILWVMVLALVITYMVLAAQFESLVHPFTVMLTVPLASIGALAALWAVAMGVQSGALPNLPGMNINLFSQIGFVLLIGLVTKNGILLVEFANQLRLREGLDAKEAMLEAARVRLRPILMTAISTIAGLLPIAIGFGAGAESRRPLGIVVVGGMLSSAFLTLFIIPVVYTVLSDLTEKVFGKKTGLAQPDYATVQP